MALSEHLYTTHREGALVVPQCSCGWIGKPVMHPGWAAGQHLKHVSEQEDQFPPLRITCRRCQETGDGSHFAGPEAFVCPRCDEDESGLDIEEV